MDEALISLLETKDLEYITVKEICRRAGVNRSTFYLHYETVADLVEEAAETVSRRFLSYFDKKEADLGGIDGRTPADLVLINEDYLLPYLEFVKDNKSIYRAAYKNPVGMKTAVRYGDLKSKIIEPVLKRFNIPDALHRYYIAYYIEGLTAIVNEWLDGGCAEPVQTVAAVIEACVRPSDGAKGDLRGR